MQESETHSCNLGGQPEDPVLSLSSASLCGKAASLQDRYGIKHEVFWPRSSSWLYFTRACNLFALYKYPLLFLCHNIVPISTIPSVFPAFDILSKLLESETNEFDQNRWTLEKRNGLLTFVAIRLYYILHCIPQYIVYFKYIP